MAGFPIVSLASLVGTYDACEVLIPQFEIDEYYMGDEAIGKQAWSGRYPTAMSAGYIKSINVYPNNINSTTGVASVITTSQGFLHFENYYSPNLELLMNVNNLRVDAFYNIFFGWPFFGFGQASNNVNVIENLYINSPNVVQIDNGMDLNISLYINNIYFNFPKVKTIGTLLSWNRYTKTLNFNYSSNLLESVGLNSFVFWDYQETIINTTFNGNVVELFGKLKTSQSAESYVVLKCGVNDLPLSEFDIRYWDIWQNSSGSDR